MDWLTRERSRVIFSDRTLALPPVGYSRCSSLPRHTTITTHNCGPYSVRVRSACNLAVSGTARSDSIGGGVDGEKKPWWRRNSAYRQQLC